jgi:putative transposase
MQTGIEFITVTCLNWNHLLLDDKRKDIIIDSLRYLVQNERIYLYSFVIMSNHIHLIWEIREGWNEKNIKQMFLKFTAQQIKFQLDANELEKYKSTQKDRAFHFWERRAWRAELLTREVLEQKLDYIHQNPVKANLVKIEEDYKYSSVDFYTRNSSKWDFITHYMERI